MKCSKCNCEQFHTPICTNCGTIPIAQSAFDDLNKQIKDLQTEVSHYKELADYYKTI